jgi:hypothetical protein
MFRAKTFARGIFLLTKFSRCRPEIESIVNEQRRLKHDDEIGHREIENEIVGGCSNGCAPEVEEKVSFNR